MILNNKFMNELKLVSTLTDEGLIDVNYHILIN